MTTLRDKVVALVTRYRQQPVVAHVDRYQCFNPYCATVFKRGTGLLQEETGYIACSPECATRLEEMRRCQT